LSVVLYLALQLAHWLQGPAECIVEDFVEEENLFDGEAKFFELALQALESLGTEPAAEQGAEMVGTQVHFNHAIGMQRERTEGNRAESFTNGARNALRADHQGSPFAQSQRLFTIGAKRQIHDPVPLASARLTLRTWGIRGNPVGGNESQTFHAYVSC
jgi:hypothetical protein